MRLGLLAPCLLALAGCALFGAGPRDQTRAPVERESEALRLLGEAALGYRHALGDARQELWEVRRRIAAAETTAASPSTPSAERAASRRALESLRAEEARLEAKIAALAQELAALERRYETMRLELAGGTGVARAVRPVPAGYEPMK
ncbi:hypothetical protein [Amphiplicatus metriothermophilus]|uniref:Uncharacterized protein n=1 Tax=Amphiplicatus metriothermophilus TaxID=1519374 RepID=A0A239PNU3_9PROT|nr:hypothetical protein [Amphiplicatus metriothermophilus]MBB5518858.1 putative nucleic acid-binding Zn-ribbon protein [Amphiplicatus metriothermophilus]SNT71989.1 hypothetical protein SAMN06297382_1011 [Amphiplicatus metriothermophilus]